MRGFWGMVLELMPGGISLAIMAGAWVAMQRRRRTAAEYRSSITLGSVLGSVLVVLWVVLAGGYSYNVARFHYDLLRLQPADVLWMQVGPRRIDDPASIAAVVADLKSGEWYSVSHGGWGDQLQIVLRLRSGESWWMQAGYHFAQHGAVINRRSIDPGSRGAFIASWGYVFSAALPDTLRRIGTPLPMCDTAHGRPCSAAAVPQPVGRR